MARRKPASKSKTSKKQARKSAPAALPARRDAADEDEDFEVDSEPPPEEDADAYEDKPVLKKKKKARTSKPAASLWVGPLEGFWAQLDDDIVDQTLSLLRPPDLLNLAHSSKTAYSRVMRQDKAYWDAAFAPLFADGLPECPESITLPQYAALIWPVRCQHCDAEENKKPEERVRWYLRDETHLMPIWTRLTLACSHCFAKYAGPSEKRHIYGPRFVRIDLDADEDGLAKQSVLDLQEVDKRALKATRSFSYTDRDIYRYGEEVVKGYWFEEVKETLIKLKQFDEGEGVDEDELAKMVEEADEETRKARRLQSRIKDFLVGYTQAVKDERKRIDDQDKENFLDAVERRLDDHGVERERYIGLRSQDYGFSVGNLPRNPQNMVYGVREPINPDHPVAYDMNSKWWKSVKSALLGRITRAGSRKVKQDEKERKEKIFGLAWAMTNAILEMIEDAEVLAPGLIPPVFTILGLPALRAEAIDLAGNARSGHTVSSEVIADAVEEWRVDFARNLARLAAKPDDRLETISDLNDILLRPSSLFKCKKCDMNGITSVEIADHPCLAPDGQIPDDDADVLPTGELFEYVDCGDLVDSIIDAGYMDPSSTDAIDLDDCELVIDPNVDFEHEDEELHDRLVNQSHSFPTLLRALLALNDLKLAQELARDVRIGWHVDRESLQPALKPKLVQMDEEEGEEENQVVKKTPDTITIFGCKRCTTFRPICDDEAEAWRHVLFEHKIAAIPGPEDSLFAVRVPRLPEDDDEENAMETDQ